MYKIAIVGAPRTATKVVTHNFSQYVMARYGSISRICNNQTGHISNHLDEFLNHVNVDSFMTKAVLDCNSCNVHLTSEKIVDTEEELYNRIEIVRNIKNYVVMKHFPYNKYAPIVDESLSIFDKLYYLTRENEFEHILSYCLGVQTNLWRPCSNQQNVIDDYLENKRRIPVKLFAHIMGNIRRYNRLSAGKKTYSFENIIKLDSARAFCDLFELEFVDFKFLYNYKEYGSNKINMISNIGQLRAVYNNL